MNLNAWMSHLQSCKHNETAVMKKWELRVPILWSEGFLWCWLGLEHPTRSCASHALKIRAATWKTLSSRKCLARGHWVFSAPNVLTPLYAAVTGMEKRFWNQVHRGRLSAPCCGWMEPGRHELCVGGVCSLEDKYPCPADRGLAQRAQLCLSRCCCRQLGGQSSCPPPDQCRRMFGKTRMLASSTKYVQDILVHLVLRYCIH